MHTSYLTIYCLLKPSDYFLLIMRINKQILLYNTFLVTIFVQNKNCAQQKYKKRFTTSFLIYVILYFDLCYDISYYILTFDFMTYYILTFAITYHTIF